MKLIIDIPKEKYDLCKKWKPSERSELQEAVANGTPLPKGHGAIIDIKQIHRVEIEDSCTGRKMIWNNNPKINDTIYYLTAPTIIDADKEE